MRKVKEIAIAIAIIIAVVASILVVVLADYKKWNDGICPNCEGKYTLIETTKGISAGSEKYYYRCNKCGHTIELHSFFEEK